MRPTARGFHCHDDSIQKPFHPNTVSTKLLLLACGCVTAAFALWTELWACIFCHDEYIHETTNDEMPNRSALPRNHISIPDKLRDFLAASSDPLRRFHSVAPILFYGSLDYLYGFMIQVAIMHIGKSGLGRLRPHFVDICRPMPKTGSDSTEQTSATAYAVSNSGLDCSNDAYIEHWEYVCNTADGSHEQFRALKHARESFPSGHSASSIYTLVFLLCYARHRQYVSRSHYLARFVEVMVMLGFAIFTAFTCVTRVTDNWHHPTDVAGGIVLGTSVALILFWGPARFQRKCIDFHGVEDKKVN